MTIQDFRTNPLSNKIVDSLLSATEAYAQADALINEHKKIMPIINHMLLALDIYYSFYNVQPMIGDICHGLYIPNNGSAFNRNVEIYNACTEFAKKKVFSTGVLTAGDLFRIDNAIKSKEAGSVSLESVSCNSEAQLESIWTVLHSIYGPQRQYPLVLETAIA